jgi:hypothetical protein
VTACLVGGEYGFDVVGVAANVQSVDLLGGMAIFLVLRLVLDDGNGNSGPEFLGD